MRFSVEETVIFLLFCAIIMCDKIKYYFLTIFAHNVTILYKTNIFFKFLVIKSLIFILSLKLYLVFLFH